MSDRYPLPTMVECPDCGRLCEAPLMPDAEECCRAAVARTVIKSATEITMRSNPDLPDEVRDAVEAEAAEYLAKLLEIDPSILGENKNKGGGGNS